jgi:8-oxo-dGTP pyrophosphatase MutT (NUDIX family)
VGRGGRGGGELNASSIIDTLAGVLAARDAALAERDPPFREAAVAIVLHARESGPHVLMLRRATHDGDPWSGQIGLPGGRMEPGDASLLETAIRETREETALDLLASRLLGALDEVRPRTPALPPIIVRPFVFTLGEHSVPPLAASPEVAELFWAPLEALLDPAAAGHATVRIRGDDRTVDAIEFEGRIVWGMTERILRSLEGVLRAAS